MKIIWKGAAAGNFEVGRKVPVDRIVLHWIVGKLSAADAEFQKPSRQASAHYGIGNKVVHQYVKEEDTAYHCGNLAFNRRSIGIEHEGGPDLPITDETYATSAELVATICKKYAIPLARTHIIGHREVAATQCPGALDIDRVIREAKALGVPATESPDLIACKAQVQDEIKKKNDLYNEKINELLPRIAELEASNKIHEENWIRVAEKLNTSASLAEIIGAIASLMTNGTSDALEKLQGQYTTLQAELDRVVLENGELRTENLQIKPLKDENEKLKTAQQLEIIGKIFSIYLARKVGE